MSTIDIQIRQIDNSRLRRDGDSLIRLEYIALTLLAGVFVVVALIYGWQQYQWIQYGYRIEEAQARVDELSEEGRRLQLEVGTLASPPRIDQTARRDLGMVDAVAGQVVTIDLADLAQPEPYPAETQLARSGN